MLLIRLELEVWRPEQRARHRAHVRRELREHRLEVRRRGQHRVRAQQPRVRELRDGAQLLRRVRERALRCVGERGAEVRRRAVRRGVVPHALGRVAAYLVVEADFQVVARAQCTALYYVLKILCVYLYCTIFDYILRVLYIIYSHRHL